MTATLERPTLRTSRLLDFSSEKEMIAQTGHQTEVRPLVVLKELVDNSLDACEEADEQYRRDCEEIVDAFLASADERRAPMLAEAGAP